MNAIHRITWLLSLIILMGCAGDVEFIIRSTEDTPNNPLNPTPILDAVSLEDIAGLYTINRIGDRYPFLHDSNPYNFEIFPSGIWDCYHPDAHIARGTLVILPENRYRITGITVFFRHDFNVSEGLVIYAEGSSFLHLIDDDATEGDGETEFHLVLERE